MLQVVRLFLGVAVDGLDDWVAVEELDAADAVGLLEAADDAVGVLEAAAGAVGVLDAAAVPAAAKPCTRTA